MELSKFHPAGLALFAFARSSYLQSVSRGSNLAVFKSCNVSAMLGEVPALILVTSIKFVMEQPKSVRLKTIHSIYPDIMEAQGSRMLGDAIPLCCTFIERGCSAIVNYIVLYYKTLPARPPAWIFPNQKLISLLPWPKHNYYIRCVACIAY